MVIGSVQSGKTANYIGVLNKAVDCGYKVIVVLAGMLDSLRCQTQLRIDDGLVGRTIEEENGTLVGRTVGVGNISGDRPYSMLSLTTATSDFSRRIASALVLNQGTSDDTVYIAVLKKNPGSLRNVIAWLDANMQTIVPNGTSKDRAITLVANWVANNMTYDYNATKDRALLVTH